MVAILRKKGEVHPRPRCKLQILGLAAIALFLLILAQSYYVIGTNLIQLLPEYGLLIEQEQAVLKGVASQKDARKHTTAQSQILSDNLLQADRMMLTAAPLRLDRGGSVYRAFSCARSARAVVSPRE